MADRTAPLAASRAMNEEVEEVRASGGRAVEAWGGGRAGRTGPGRCDPLADMGEPYLTSKLQGFGTTIFAEMSALAVATGSVNLGQGFPDTDGPAEVLDAAIAAALLALCEPGDEVVTFEPYYDSYAACIALAGARRVPVTLRPPDYAIDADALAAAFSPRTRLVLLNTPHNPTGKVFTPAELELIAGHCRERDVLAVSDEVYEHLVYDGREHVPLATLPGMAERTLTISSAGKTFSVTGWKIGWACGPRALVAAVQTAKQFLTFVSGAPFQPAIAHALGLPDAYFESFRADLEAKRDRLCDGLEAAGLEVFRPAGTYFITADIRPLGEDDGHAFCMALPERAGVVAVPTVVFYDDKDAGRSLVRFAFCKRDDVIDASAARMARL